MYEQVLARCTDGELAAEFVFALKSGGQVRSQRRREATAEDDYLDSVLAEFRRRYWNREVEHAAACGGYVVDDDQLSLAEL